LNTICRFYPTRELGKRWQRLTVVVVNKLIAAFEWESSRNLITGYPYATLFSFNTFETSLELILLAVNQLQPDYFCKISFWDLFYFFSMMFRLPGMLSEDHNRISIIQLLRNRVTSNRLGFILTKECSLGKVNTWDANPWNEEYLDIARLLFEAGANPNVGLGGTENAPLHLAASLDDHVLSGAITSLLVDFGAHVVRVNKAGQTATDIWIATRNRYEAETGWNALPDWCRTLPSLLCLAARVIRVHKSQDPLHQRKNTSFSPPIRCDALILYFSFFSYLSWFLVLKYCDDFVCHL